MVCCLPRVGLNGLLLPSGHRGVGVCRRRVEGAAHAVGAGRRLRLGDISNHLWRKVALGIDRSRHRVHAVIRCSTYSTHTHAAISSLLLLWLVIGSSRATGAIWVVVLLLVVLPVVVTALLLVIVVMRALQALLLTSIAAVLVTSSSQLRGPYLLAKGAKTPLQLQSLLLSLGQFPAQLLSLLLVHHKLHLHLQCLHLCL